MKIGILVPDNRDESRQYSKPTPFFGTAVTALLEGFTQIPECEVHIISCTQRHLQAPPRLADNIFFHSLVVPKWGWLRSGYIGCVRAVRKKLHEIQPDIVHAQGTERYCAISAVRSGFPNVVTIHGNMRAVAKVNQARPFTFKWLAARLEGFTLPQTLGVFCNSRYTEELVRSCARQTWLVPNAIRTKFFAPPIVVEAQVPPVLLNIGVIEPRKSQHKVLEMARRLYRRQARFQLHFVGRLDGASSYGAEFRRLIEQAKAEGYADYLGEKSEEELIQIMDNANGLIHAPREEAFGLVVAEAMSRNLALFGFKVGGLLDIARGVDGADLVEPGDFAALEEAIIKWLSVGYPKCSDGSKTMRQRYHPSVIAQSHLAIYTELLTHGGF